MNAHGIIGQSVVMIIIRGIRPTVPRWGNLDQFGWITWLCGGYTAARLEHFILTIGYVLFFLIHIIQVIKAGWKNFKSMITGFEVVSIIKPVNTNVDPATPGDQINKVV